MACHLYWSALVFARISGRMAQPIRIGRVLYQPITCRYTVSIGNVHAVAVGRIIMSIETWRRVTDVAFKGVVSGLALFTITSGVVSYLCE